MAPQLTQLDHLVLTAADLDLTVAFYRDILGLVVDEFTPPTGAPRLALRIGRAKINLHQQGAEFLPHAGRPTVGALDLCFLSDTPLSQWQAHLRDHGIAIEDGPVRRTGARSALMSIYLRDPDGNLIEIANQI